MVIAFLLFVALVVGGLYVFVPAVHTALANAYKTASDDLDKIAVDAKALVARVESHGKAQQAAATNLQAAATTAQTNATAATEAAAALKTVVAAIPPAATPAAK